MLDCTLLLKMGAVGAAQMNKKELRQLSKNELVRIILDQEERISSLEQYLQSFDNPHTPSSKQHKKNTERDSNKPRFPGKPEGSNGGSIKIPPPDSEENHTLQTCPNCNNKIGKPINQYSRTIIDIPNKPIQTIKHNIYQYHCKHCTKIVQQNVTLPTGVYGNKLKSLIIMLRGMTNSCERTSQLFKMLGCPTLSPATILSMGEEASKLLEKKQQSLQSQLRKSPWLCLDETSMRQDGKNGYVWTICTQGISTFNATLSRGAHIIKNLLPNYNGVIITDGYNAYNNFPHRQRCWAHLLREFHDKAQKSKSVKVQHERLKKLYDHLCELKKKPPNQIPQQHWKKILFERDDIINCLKDTQEGIPLATLFENGGDDWFTALKHEGVPLTNNLAERKLRPLVCLRKAIGCYRTDKGKRWINIVLSILHTWQLQGKNPFKMLTRTFVGT